MYKLTTFVQRQNIEELWIDQEASQVISNEDNTTECDFDAITKIKSNIIHGSFGRSQNANTNKLSGELYVFLSM